MDQQTLIKLLKSKDKKSISYLFDTHYERLYLFAEKFIYDTDQAHDIVQEVFIRLWENSANLEINTSLSHYLFAAVRNRCLDYLRALRIEDRHHRKYFEAYIESHTIDAIQDDELLEKIKNMMDNFPPQCREIFELRLLQGYKYKEIAERLNVSESVVKVQIHRAYRKLKDSFPAIKGHLPLFLLAVIIKF